MEDGRADIRWSPRVSKSEIRRLYESEAKGLLDEALLDEVGMGLLLRCRDILTIEQAGKERQVRCPRCEREGRQSLITRVSRSREERLQCPECGWGITWAEYQRSFKRRQLHVGGAGPAFRTFVERYPRARTAREKMLLVDRLIHEFHYSLRDDPERPTRAVCVNLISGRLTDVVAFLNELAYGKGSAPESRAVREA